MCAELLKRSQDFEIDFEISELKYLVCNKSIWSSSVLNRNIIYKL